MDDISLFVEDVFIFGVESVLLEDGIPVVVELVEFECDDISCVHELRKNISIIKVAKKSFFIISILLSCIFLAFKINIFMTISSKKYLH